jgi:hypothetical protein
VLVNMVNVLGVSYIFGRELPVFSSLPIFTCTLVAERPYKPYNSESGSDRCDVVVWAYGSIVLMSIGNVCFRAWGVLHFWSGSYFLGFS